MIICSNCCWSGILVLAKHVFCSGFRKTHTILLLFLQSVSRFSEWSLFAMYDYNRVTHRVRLHLAASFCIFSNTVTSGLVQPFGLVDCLGAPGEVHPTLYWCITRELLIYNYTMTIETFYIRISLVQNCQCSCQGQSLDLRGQKHRSREFFYNFKMPITKVWCCT